MNGNSSYRPPSGDRPRDWLGYLILACAASALVGVGYIVYLVAESRRPYEVTEFREWSFTPVSVKDVQDYAAYREASAMNRQKMGLWMQSRPEPEYREGDVVTVWVSYAKREPIAADFSVTYQSDDDLCTISPSIPRRSELKVGEKEDYLQLETIRAGTIPCEYTATVTYIYAPPGKVPDKTTFTTGRFKVVPATVTP